MSPVPESVPSPVSQPQPKVESPPSIAAKAMESSVIAKPPMESIPHLRPSDSDRPPNAEDIAKLQAFIKSQAAEKGGADMAPLMATSSAYEGASVKPLPMRIFEGIIKFFLGLFGVKLDSPTPQPQST